MFEDEPELREFAKSYAEKFLFRDMSTETALAACWIASLVEELQTSSPTHQETIEVVTDRGTITFFGDKGRLTHEPDVLVDYVSYSSSPKPIEGAEGFFERDAFDLEIHSERDTAETYKVSGWMVSNESTEVLESDKVIIPIKLRAVRDELKAATDSAQKAEILKKLKSANMDPRLTPAELEREKEAFIRIIEALTIP